jgi:glutamate carboxypeptidase
MLEIAGTRLMEDYLPHFQPLQTQMAWRLGTLVELETPTSEKAAVDTMARELAAWATEFGAQVQIHSQSMVGDFVECKWNDHLPGKPIVLLAHMDTVHPLGSVEKRPTQIEGDILYGVGAYDMKGGIVVAQQVIEFLQTSDEFPQRPVTMLFNSDEEIGSHYSRRWIEQRLRDTELAIVMEFCNYAEDVVIARKGVGIFQITALGKEAHSGGGPDAGINAIVEVGHHLGSILALADRSQGTFVTPTVIRGGTRHNVIPGECEVVINVRVKYASEAERVDTGMMAITEATPYLSGAEMILTGDFVRPPLENNDLQQQTLDKLRRVTGSFIDAETRGEGSDANFAGALGVPTLCGMGPSGEGAHASNEQVYLPSMPRRAALLASILSNW